MKLIALILRSSLYSSATPRVNLVVINNGHKDYVFASRKPGRKLKYICRLYAKELVLANFPGFDRRELLERMIELSLYAEENLR
jgi:hypothetical protein